MPGGQHSADVIRQGQERAHRNVRLTTRGRRPIIRRRRGARGRAGYRALPPVGQPDEDQSGPAPRTPIADRVAAPIKRMLRVNDTDLSDSPIKG
jgi:hypothetical protein